MPTIIRDKNQDVLVAAIGREAGAITLREVAGILGEKISRRTLQRRLAALVDAGRLERVGGGPTARYRLAADPIMPARPAGMAAAPAEPPALVPTSTESRRLADRVRAPLANRTPVGYQRAFLDSYVPDVTSYLPPLLRDKLHALGRSSSNERPAGTYARDVLGRLLIDLSWASSTLEGNTYTRLDTQNLIEFGLVAEGKGQRDAQMILNHKAAIEMLVEDVESIGFNRFTLQNLHALLSDGLLTDATASGRLRVIPVEISGTVFVPLAIPQQIEEYFDRLLAKAQAITDPFEQAFFVMVQIPYLQPFEDVNKRVSRLAANIPFIKRNLSPLSFVDVPEAAYIDGTLAVYELNRVDLLREVFVWAYERSCLRYVALKDSLPEPDPLRLRNRQALIEIVADVVRANTAVSPADLRGRARDLVTPADLDQFVAMVLSELHHLHDGNVARYRLRLSELRRWQHRPRR